MAGHHKRDPYFPWKHLGLRSNPFKSLTKEDWMGIAILQNDLVDWIQNPSDILQIHGDKGVGKSSTLFALQKHLAQEGFKPKYFYIPMKGSKTYIDYHHPGPLLVDEAQRLSSRVRRKLYQRNQNLNASGSQVPSLVFTTHEDFSDDLRQFLVDFKSIHLSVLDEADLAHLLERRLQYFAVDETCEVRFHPQAVHLLSSSFGPNLRQMESFLYDFFQDIPQQPIITAELLARHLKN
jgi:chromosomal replication initiation ATPase DnaA